MARIKIHSSDHLETLRRCGGFYECPKDGRGNRLGPLVGYAGTYEDANGVEKHFVGDIYANFAKAEEHWHVVEHFARQLVSQLDDSGLARVATAVLGAPMGGLFLAAGIGQVTGLRIIYAEKKVVALASATSREASVLILDRHEVYPGDKVFFMEDVCNNFSTTEKLLDLVYKAGGSVLGILCFLNRSPYHRYQSTRQVSLPIFACVNNPMQQYRQDDPAVAEDLARGNVAWKPKNDWARLERAVANAER